jgi:hypothetical protein
MLPQTKITVFSSSDMNSKAAKLLSNGEESL